MQSQFHLKATPVAYRSQRVNLEACMQMLYIAIIGYVV